MTLTMTDTPITNNVIRIDHATWYTMRQLKENIAFMKTNAKEYSISLKGEEDLLRHFMTSVVKRKEAA